MSSAAVKTLSINFVKENQKYLFLLFKLLVAAALLLYIFYSVNFNEIFLAASNINYYFLTFAFLLVIPNLFLQYWKWKIVCNSLLEEKDKRKIFFSLFYGFSAGIFTPGRIGEYFGRGMAFKNKSLINIAAAVFIDKFFPLLIVIFFGLISSVIYLNNFYDFPFYFSLLIFFGIIISAVILYLSFQQKRESFNGYYSRLIKKIFQGRGKFSKQLQKIILNLGSLKKIKKNISLKLLIISFLFYTCFLIQFVLLFSAFSSDFSFLEYFYLSSIIMFVKTFIPQISIGELGIREGTSIYFLMQAGGSASAALSASMFLFFINLLFPALIGLLFLFRKNND